MKRNSLLIITLLGALGLAAGGGFIAMKDSKAEVVSAGSTYDITNANFTTYFDRGSSHVADTLNITEDIDLSGATQASAGIAGTFTGTINGNGHTISNFVLPTGQAFLLWTVGSAGSINDLTITGTTASGANSFGFLANQMNGTATNLTFNITTNGGVNTGGVTWGADTGTWTNCRANWTVPSSSPNTLYRIGKEDSATYNNCTYTLSTGEGASAAFVPATDGKVTLATNVSAVTVNDVEAVIDGSTTETATLTGNVFDHIKWTVGDTTIATVASASTTTASVGINGVAAGTTTLTANVYADAAEGTLLATDSGTITISTSSPVTAIALSPTSASIVEGKTTNLTGTLTGVTYDHITWSTSNESAATVVGTDKTAVVTAVAAGSATISAKVYSAATENETNLLATGTSAITVTAAVKFDLYIASETSKGWTSENVIFYGGGITETTLPMTSVAHDLVISGTTFDLWYLQVNATSLGMVGKTGVYLICGNGQNAGRWGSGYSADTYTNGFAVYTPAASNGTLTSIGNGADLKAALTWLDGDSGLKRVSSDICYYLNTENSSKLSALKSGYNGLSDNSKAMLGYVIDTTVDETVVTVATTMAYLANQPVWSGASIFSFPVNGETNESIILYVALGVIILGAALGIAYVIKRKRA